MRWNPSVWGLIALGVVNSVTYSCLLPLWEGFDEPFHFGYVQHLAREKQLPRLGVTVLSAEVWESVKIAPASHVVRWSIPALMTFDEFYRQDVSRQRLQIESIYRIPTTLADASATVNYETHQPPLAYAVLGPFEAALASQPLPYRVLALRILASLLSALLTIAGAFWLSREWRLESPWRECALFCTLSSQMYYASVAHVANDWLAVPLLTLWIAAGSSYIRVSTKRNALWWGLVTAACLLTKAYFLVLLPLTALVLAWVSWRRRLIAPALTCVVLTGLAAPWYMRNVALYGNVSGTVEATNGVTPARVLSAVPSVPWLQSITYMARASVWTGNNSFTNFSKPVMNSYLGIMAGLLLLYLTRQRQLSAAQALSMATILVFIAAIAYATAASYLFTQGRSAGASPWYMQPLLLPTMFLAFSGARLGGAPGRYLGIALCAISAYLILATYIVKLIPLYAGFPFGKVTLLTLVEWYGHLLNHGVVSLSLAPLPGVFALAMLIVAGTLILGFRLMRAIIKTPVRKC